MYALIFRCQTHFLRILLLSAVATQARGVSADIFATKSCSQLYCSTRSTLEKEDRSLITSRLSQFAPHFLLNESEFYQQRFSIPPDHNFSALDLLWLHVTDRQSVALSFCRAISVQSLPFYLHWECASVSMHDDSSWCRQLLQTCWRCRRAVHCWCRWICRRIHCNFPDERKVSNSKNGRTACAQLCQRRDRMIIRSRGQEMTESQRKQNHNKHNPQSKPAPMWPVRPAL